MLSTSEIIQVTPQIRTIQNFNSIQNKELRHLAKRTHCTLLNSLHLKKSTFSVNIFHELYSKDSIRFCYDGFDIDLTYITSKILSMSFPSYNSFTTLYRNKLSDIYKFLHFRHNSHYKVYNLCQERQFSSQQVFQEQEYIPIPRSHPPSLKQILIFCTDAANFLLADPKNVVVVTSENGRGRAGVMICCLILYMKIIKCAKDSIIYFGIMRSINNKGITVPSQMRYIYYFDKLVKKKGLSTEDTNIDLNKFEEGIKRKIIITKIRMYTIPLCSFFKQKCRPVFQIENGHSLYNMEDHIKIKEYTKNSVGIVDFNINHFNASGDIICKFFHRNKIGHDSLIFRFCINSYFIPEDGVLTIKKDMIDEACNDVMNEIFHKNFKIELHCVFVESLNCN